MNFDSLSFPDISILAPLPAKDDNAASINKDFSPKHQEGQSLMVQLVLDHSIFRNQLPTFFEYLPNRPNGQLQPDRQSRVEFEWQPTREVVPRALGTVVARNVFLKNQYDPFPLTTFLKKRERLQTLISFNKAQQALSLKMEDINVIVQRIQNRVTQGQLTQQEAMIMINQKVLEHQSRGTLSFPSSSSSFVFRGSMRRRRSQNINTFPTMVAHQKRNVFESSGSKPSFSKQDELRSAMNLYQKQSAEDISCINHLEKDNAMKKWKVVGLIDPNKHLSTLDHSLNLKAMERTLQQYPSYPPSYSSLNHTQQFNPFPTGPNVPPPHHNVLGPQFHFSGHPFSGYTPSVPMNPPLVNPQQATSSAPSPLSSLEIVNYHHWIPSVFRVNAEGTAADCQLLSEIPNLDPYRHGDTLYPLIADLFLHQLAQFENVLGLNLRNVALKVVVKAQDYQLSDCRLSVEEDSSFLGNFHKEGLHEDIAAVGLYYYHIDEGIKGGELELSSIVDVANSDQMMPSNVMYNGEYNGYGSGGSLSLKQIRVPVAEGTSLVFSNDLCYHRVCKLHGNGSRKMIAFFLLRDGVESARRDDRQFNSMEMLMRQSMMGMNPNNFNPGTEPTITAQNVVVNWKHHSRHFVESNLRDILGADEYGARGNEWLIRLVQEYVVGDRKYIEKAMDINRHCRFVQGQQLEVGQNELTSRYPLHQMPMAGS